MTRAPRRTHLTSPALLTLLALAAPLALSAQPIAGSARLKAQARVTGDSARRIALAQVPNGRIRSGEIERERGKLIYSFDIAVAGKSGIEEVNVDALTGAVAGHEHETPARERAEARQQKAVKPKP